MKAKARYVVGIDLGTTNTVVAYTELGAAPQIRLSEIDQLVAPGEVAARTLLPSARYHPAIGELSAGETQLPWAPADSAVKDAPPIIGRLARDLGAQVPGRLVASAKSWLSHASVDRTAAILPWGADESVGKVSPVAASASYLAHVRAAWNTRFAGAPLEDQQLVLTVPASFDEGARALTVEAARLAGLPKLHLLEEPQAALYDWLYQHRDHLATELAETKLVLVCDVGGGTTDLSLIQVAMQNGTPQLTRIGVGDHLMLGGDNMDLALAHLVEARLAGSAAAAGSGASGGTAAGAAGASGAPTAPSASGASGASTASSASSMSVALSAPTAAAKLTASQLSQLTQRCRAAKEQLLAADAPESVSVTLLGGGARLIGGARSVPLTRDEVHALLVDGFFPRVAASEHPQRLRGGIVEFGLPYASDPAITRHVAAFLSRHAAASRQALGESSSDALPLPDTLLLNGGVFRADALARRVASVLGGWGDAAPRVLHNDHLDAAVARGAVAYALAREGRAPRIGGGSARSYFLVLDDDAASVDKASSKRGVCVLPRGSEEGREVRLTDRSFALRVGRPVQFHLVSSAADTAYRPGEIVDLTDGDFVRLPPIATVVAPTRSDTTIREVPVQLATSLTEVGTLEMHCIAIAEGTGSALAENGAGAVAVEPQRWQLEFQLRGNAPAPIETAAVHPRLAEAADKIDRIFGGRSQQVDAKEVKQLRAQLERLLGERDSWDTPLLRELFAALLERSRRRRRSSTHERLWLHLAGYCLRPGTGYPLDDWRVEQLAALFDAGIQYGKESQLWSEWWTLWRRVAGGLTQAQQEHIFDDIAPLLQPELVPPNARPNAKPASATKPAAVVKGGHEDMVKLAASLERLPVARKVQLGVWLLARLRQPAENVQTWWAVGRIGARQPFFGSAHNVVPADTAAEWLATILALDWQKIEPAAFAAAQIARRTGDRSRDLPDETRAAVVERLEAMNAPKSWIAMVREVVELDEGDARRVFGDSLPAGLTLIG